MGKKQKATGGDAVIYARYSSHNQRDVSIEQQVEACRKHAAELGLTVTATYEDRAISGKTDKRPSFQRMMRDAEQHKFAYVLAWKSNRIGRNMMQALVNESRLVDCGVKVFYAEEDFDDNAAGRFALRSMMNVNQFYIENMAEDVKRGLYDNAKKGLVNGSLPLGYKRGADGKPEIDEPKAAIVREIYTRVAAGELFASIAADLNARGIRTARGREWNKGSFHVLCHNDRYRGIYMYGDIRIPGGMPRIISDELFYDAQEAYGMKKDNRYGRARHGAENYLLTGKLYCGHCGSYMVGISGTSKTGEMHYYYACQKHRLEHTCEKKAIRRDVIENAVARVIMMYCLDDETIDFIVDSTIAYFKQKDHELHIEAMENELVAVQQAISNLMKAIEAGIITPTTRTRLLDLEEQQAKLSAKINTAKAERVEIDRDDLIAGLQLFRTGDIKNKKFLAKLFNTFLLAVYLYDDNRLKIVFSFTGNHNNIEIPLELDNDCPDSESGPYETEVRMSHLECRKDSGTPPSSGGAEKGDGCSGGRFVRTAPLPPRKTVSYGWASAMQQATVQLGKIAVQAIVNTMGVQTMAAFTAASRIDDFAYTPQQNIGHAMTTLMAQNRGAGKPQRVRQGFVCGMRIEFAYTIGLSLVCFLGAEGIMGLFVQDPAVQVLGARFLRLIALLYFLPAATNGIQGYFRGTGDLKVTLRSSILNMAARVPAAALLVLCFHLEIEALPWSYAVGWLLMLAYELPKLWRCLHQQEASPEM